MYDAMAEKKNEDAEKVEGKQNEDKEKSGDAERLRPVTRNRRRRRKRKTRKRRARLMQANLKMKTRRETTRRRRKSRETRRRKQKVTPLPLCPLTTELDYKWLPDGFNGTLANLSKNMFQRVKRRRKTAMMKKWREMQKSKGTELLRRYLTSRLKYTSKRLNV